MHCTEWYYLVTRYQPSDIKGFILYKTSIFHNFVRLRNATGHYEFFLWELFPWVECDGSRLVKGNQVWTRPCAQVVILHEAAWVMDWLNRIWAMVWHCFNKAVKKEGIIIGSQWISLNRYRLPTLVTESHPHGRQKPILSFTSYNIPTDDMTTRVGRTSAIMVLV